MGEVIPLPFFLKNESYMEMTMLPVSLISAHPSKESATLVRRNFYFKMISSLIYLISIASGESQNQNVMSLVRNPTNARSLNPRLFYLHDSLLSAVRKKDEPTMQKLIQLINDVANEKIVSNSDFLPEISTVGSSDWEKFIVENSKVLGKECFSEVPIIEPIPAALALTQKDFISESIEMVANYFPEMHEETKVFLNKIRLFDGTVTMGITDVRMFGCMFIRTPRSGVNAQLYYAEHITHEVSHMYLNAAMSIDPLILNDRSELFQSPIRPDPRPMLGVFHATFVTSRIVELFSRLSTSIDEKQPRIYLHQQIDELEAGIREVDRGAKLTDIGRVILEEFREIADKAKSLAVWNDFDRSEIYEHRFGGGRPFKPARIGLLEQNSTH